MVTNLFFFGYHFEEFRSQVAAIIKWIPKRKRVFASSVFASRLVFLCDWKSVLVALQTVIYTVMSLFADFYWMKFPIHINMNVLMFFVMNKKYSFFLIAECCLNEAG